jgi:hypothetical protein
MASPGQVLVPTHGQATVKGHHSFHSPTRALARPGVGRGTLGVTDGLHGLKDFLQGVPGPPFQVLVLQAIERPPYAWLPWPTFHM